MKSSRQEVLKAVEEALKTEKKEETQRKLQQIKTLVENEENLDHVAGMQGQVLQQANIQNQALQQALPGQQEIQQVQTINQVQNSLPQQVGQQTQAAPVQVDLKDVPVGVQNLYRSHLEKQRQAQEGLKKNFVINQWKTK